jgi:hypothetical protein
VLHFLLRPFSYLSIGHKSKWKIDWLIPILLALMSIFIVFFLRRYGSISVYSDNGIISRILSFVQSLPGFYIAALAAIATFNKTDIDNRMPEPAPTIDIIVQGKSIEIALTRRRFLCSMFAFLTAESILLIVVAIFSLSIAPVIKAVIAPQLTEVLSGVFFLFYSILFWQMIVASFWGLYYLGEKLHQPDPKLNGN